MTPELVQRVASRYLRRQAKRTINLSHYGLEGLPEGQPVKLYHGTTASFRKFDLNKSRDELVNRFYGKGIFLTPRKQVAAEYAEANRNIGFDPSIIGDLKRKNSQAGEFLRKIYELGSDAWEAYARENGFWNDNPPEGQGTMDIVGLEEQVGVDTNTLSDIAGYIIGHKPFGSSQNDSGFVNIFDQSTGAPGWLYDSLDEVGLDSTKYRPKVYTVSVTVSNPLITASKAQARKARSRGYDSVVFYGSDLVGGIPEVAVFNPRDVKIQRVEIV
jgi:hypothetical protein